MKQIICKNMKKMLSCIVALSIIACLGVLTSCSSNDNPSSGDTISEKADLVVYGKIFTAEGNQIAEAFAVKDGKYIYVGDKTGAEAYVEAGKTEVVDYTGKGLVMPGCGNGHAHYSMANAIKLVGATVGLKDNAGTDEKSGADLVVIGKIFTSEDNQMAEAFAVKDGKYVYVGDKAGAEQYIVNGKT